MYHDFRLFYNQSIHPELLHLERRRQRLVRLLSFAALLIGGVVALQLALQIFVLTLVLFLPVGFMVAYLGFRVQVYFQEFKPRIVGLILDFIDNDVNYSGLAYQPKGLIDKKRFLESLIFNKAEDYAGEDLIKGQVRETPFELCELRVQAFSPVLTQLDEVFQGVFLIGHFRRPDMRGKLLVIPDALRKYFLDSTRRFHLQGGRRVRNNMLIEFERLFDTYATPDARVKDILSADMQRAVLAFRQRFRDKNRKKELYFSIIDDKIYLALSQDTDLLEPSLLASNVSYELIREYYDDIRLLLDLVRDVDVMN